MEYIKIEHDDEGRVIVDTGEDERVVVREGWEMYVGVGAEIEYRPLTYGTGEVVAETEVAETKIQRMIDNNNL